jgi:hypothetical protein
MWNNTILFNIFFKEMEKISLERSQKGMRHIFSFGFYKIYLIGF